MYDANSVTSCFLTPDWGGDQGLPGLPADCVWCVWLQFQTQPVHTTREVPGGPGHLGASWKGNQPSSLFVAYGWKCEWHSQGLTWEFRCWSVILEPLHSKWKSVICRPREHLYFNEWVLFSATAISSEAENVLFIPRDSTSVLSLSGFAVESNSLSVDQLYILHLGFSSKLLWERAGNDSRVSDLNWVIIGLYCVVLLVVDETQWRSLFWQL